MVSEQDTKFFCAGCGASHESLPAEAICKQCGHPQVVDLQGASREQLLEAIAARTPRRKLLARDLKTAGIGIAVIIGPLLIASMTLYSGIPPRRAVEVSTTVPFDSSDKALEAFRDYPKTIKAAQKGFQACFAAGGVELKPRLGAVIKAQWVVKPDGSVTEQQPLFATVADPAVDCIMDHLEVMKFTPPPQNTQATVTAKFTYFLFRGAPGLTVPKKLIVHGGDDESHWR